MAIGTEDPAVVTAANDCLKGARYLNGQLEIVPSGTGIYEEPDGTLSAIPQATAAQAEVYGADGVTVNFPYVDGCVNPIVNNCAGDMYLDHPGGFDYQVDFEEEIILPTATNSRVLGTKQISINPRGDVNEFCEYRKFLLFYGGVTFHTTFNRPASEAPVDSEGQPVAETQVQYNKRVGLPGYHVDCAVYMRDHYFQRGYTFTARDSGHMKDDNAAFFVRTVTQNVPVNGFVALNDRLVLDLHVAPAVWMRSNGPIYVSTKVTVHVKTMQMEFRL